MTQTFTSFEMHMEDNSMQYIVRKMGWDQTALGSNPASAFVVY